MFTDMFVYIIFITGINYIRFVNTEAFYRIKNIIFRKKYKTLGNWYYFNSSQLIKIVIAI